YVMPTVKEIVEKLQELIDLGFKPTAAVILDILQLFENRLNNVGERIINSFISVRKNEKREEFYKKIVVEAIKSERNIKKVEVFNFLDQIIGNKSKSIFMDAMKIIRGKSPSYSIGGTNAIEDFHSVKSVTTTPCYKPLSFNLTFYNWILMKFTENSEIAKFAFNDIIETRIGFDLYQNSSEYSLCKFIETKFIEACNIFKVYCNARNFFLVSYLELLKKDIRRGNSMSDKFKKCVEVLYYKLRYDEIFDELEMELEMNNNSIKKHKACEINA
ncbi:11947_t:CDS:2, partial [Dentiscutata erythropus]